MEQHDFYPEKPVLIERQQKNNVALTVFSIVLFVSTFLMIFTDELFFVFGVLIVLLIHEMGHFLVMKRYKYTDVYMLFIPLMGAFVQGRKSVYSQKESIWVIVAGPLPGMIIGFGLLYLSTLNQAAWMVDLGLLFLLLNWINFIPLDPLDGGQLFNQLMKKNQAFFLLVFSFTSSILIIATGWYLQSWGLVVFGFVMGFRVRTLQKHYLLRKQLDELEVKYHVQYAELSNRDFAKIKSLLLSQSRALTTYVEAVEHEESDQVLADQVNNVLVSPVTRDASWVFKSLIILTWIVSVFAPFIFYFIFSDSIPLHYEWYFELLSGK